MSAPEHEGGEDGRPPQLEPAELSEPPTELAAGRERLSSWLFSDTLLARKVGRPLAGLVQLDAAAGVALAVAVVVGLAWANSPWSGVYRSVWSTEILVHIGPLEFDENLRATLNDAAMALFFFTIGLEIKRELVAGSLRHPKVVALPVAAAVGGMVLPAALYTALTVGTPAVRGWAIPMATDTAVALAVALVAGPSMPRSAIAFLLTLAVVDDIAVIGVIAVFYTDTIRVGWIVASLVLLAVVLLLKRARVWYVPVYVAVGTAVWYCVWRSGVHATMAGVVLGLLTPATPLHPSPPADGGGGARQVRRAGFALRESVSVAERLRYAVQPWVGFVVLPLFALANSGIPLSGHALTHALSSRAAVAVIVAALAGKSLGIFCFAWLAQRLGLAHLPDQLRWGHVVSMGLLGAVEFTVSVYVAGLSFTGELDTDAKLAVIATTVVAAVAAAASLRRVGRRDLDWSSTQAQLRPG